MEEVFKGEGGSGFHDNNNSAWVQKLRNNLRRNVILTFIKIDPLITEEKSYEAKACKDGCRTANMP